MADHHQHQLSKSFPVKPKLKPKPRTQKQTPESKHWSSYKSHQIPDLFSAVTSISFSPASPSTFAAAHSASVTLFNSDTLSPSSAITSFPDVVSSAAFRCDGLLLAAGDISGLVQVFDVKTRTPLRKLRSHTRPVRFVDYPVSDKLHLISGGDDALVKYWDVAAEKPLLDLSGHRDYVRCGAFAVSDDRVFATGSYDHTIRVWDARVVGAKNSTVMEFDHGAPVEDVVFLPSGGLVATAGGDSVKVWDVLGGGRLVGSMESHNKTVTSLCVGKYDNSEYRVMSVSLDGYLKVFDYGAMKVTHSMRFPAPLMSVAFSPDCGTRAIGTSNGSIYVGKRKPRRSDDSVDNEKSRRQAVLRPTNFRYFRRGQGEKALEGEYVVGRPKKAKVSEQDRLLRKFRHKEALVLVLGSNKGPGNVAAVVEELVARKKLFKCVENLDSEELGLLLGFLSKHVAAPRFSGLLMGFVRKVVELRADDIRASPVLRNHIRNLKRAVEEEIKIQNSLLEIQGVISPLLRLTARGGI